MDKAICVNSLYKSYGDLPAVKGISFDVEQGTFFAFLGPNGAGKSTTISIVCSLLPKDSGDVTILGKDPEEARGEIGMVFQDNKLDPRLTVRENLMIRGSLYGFQNEELVRRVDTALERSGSTEFAERQYSKLSGGQKRRAEIGRAIVHDPKILMLDEPTAGLDPQTRKLIWNNIYSLKESGMTVFLTTHYMEEAADADDVVIVNKGEIVAHGTPSVLKEKYSSDYLEVLPKDLDRIKGFLDERGLGYIERSDVLRIPLDDTMKAIPIINGIEDFIESFEVRTGTLDDAFINITGGIEE